MKKLSLRLLVLSILISFSAELEAQVATITVYGKCDMCKERIEKAALEVSGVKDANYNIDDQELQVNTKKGFDVNELHLAMTKAGHDTDALKAMDEVYENLHFCCHYREEDPPADIINNRNTEAQSEEDEDDLSPFITGHIYELNDEEEKIPVIGANVLWKGATSGVATDVNGSFEIGRIGISDELVISYVGYGSDTLDMSQRSTLNWTLDNDVVLEEVEVTHRQQTSEVSMIDPIQTVNISEEELCKAACCNLSESFETSPAVDVSFTDAVTGTRQIQMLGLAGKYVQITRELIPDIRGLSSVLGLTYTPGAWIESLQLSKGTGSVVNGHEGMTGQINVELRKPRAKEKMYLNLYANQGGRYEGNLFTSHKLNKRVATAFLLHGSTRDRQFDRNEDGFLDMPLGQDFLAINRWKFQSESGWQGQVGVKVNHLNRASGELSFNEDLHKLSTESWGATNETRRYEAWSKVGKILNEEKNRSFGIQLSAVTHNQDMTFGTRAYQAEQDYLFSNFIFQTDVGRSGDILKFGASFSSDVYDEELEQQIFLRDEKTAGLYSEYTWKTNELMTLVAGMRVDHHNQYGLMYTPRMHFRVATSETFETVFRLIAGRGWRTANIISENLGALASGRNLSFIFTEEGNPYSLKPEEAWNFGFNFSQKLYLGRRSGTFTADYYFTRFDNQIVADFESSPNGDVIFTNQEDITTGHSIQTQLDMELLPKFDVRLAYRYNYSEARFGNEIKAIPLVPFHRAFANLAYEAPGSWFFDVTVNWRGEQRIPSTDWLDQEDRLEDRSPDFVTVNAQVRKIFKDNFELYVGAENLLDYTQDNPIVNSETPFARDFDASLVWGPIFGRNIYAGLRYRLK